jgi:hypothetical protein
MHGALPETIDAANAARDEADSTATHDDEAASVMQIQPLACGIGCHQHIDAPAIERIDGLSPVIRVKGRRE